MGHAQYDPATHRRPMWNAGKTVGTKRPLTQKQIWAVRFFLDREGRVRDRALFDLAIDSKLRGCDLVKIKIGDLVSGPEIRSRAIVIQQKTGRPVQFELTADVRASLIAWLERRGGTVHNYTFRVDHAGHLSTRQYARLVDEWVDAVGLRRAEYETHSLRRTKASMIYKATGNLRAIQVLLGHTKIENTVRCLGVDIEDALVLAERTEINSGAAHLIDRWAASTPDGCRPISPRSARFWLATCFETPSSCRAKALPCRSPYPPEQDEQKAGSVIALDQAERRKLGSW